MIKLCFGLVLLFSGSALCSVLNNVRVVDIIPFMGDVISKTVQELEQKGWSDLTLPEFSVNVNDQVLNWHASGTMRYTNGFLVSIQRVDILQSSVTQVWSFNNTDGTATVNIRGTLRLINMAIGYDIESDFEDVSHRHSAVFTHPLISFVFNVIKNIHTDTLQVTAVGTVPTLRATIRPWVLPETPELVSDFLVTSFEPTHTAPGILSWGQEVFAPIALKITETEVPFPELCYNCS